MGTQANGIKSASDVAMEYFEHNPQPRDLEKHTENARVFIGQHTDARRRVALVTSGGTTVSKTGPILS